MIRRYLKHIYYYYKLCMQDLFTYILSHVVIVSQQIRRAHSSATKTRVQKGISRAEETSK